MTVSRKYLRFNAIAKDAFRFFCKLTFRKIINFIAIYFSYLVSVITRKVIHAGMPVSLTVETSSVCNLACPECPTGNNELTRPIGVVTKKMFFSVVDQTYKKLINLSLYFQGEPFLHPKLYYLISYSNKHNVYTSCSTNGNLLTETFGQKVIEAGLDRLIISIDGADKETYEAYRSGGNFDTLINGIKGFVQLKKEMKVSHPLIILQFIVFKTNEHQINDIKKLAKSLGADMLEIKTAQFHNFANGNPLMPENEKYSRYKINAHGKYELKNQLKNKCFRMWSSSVMTWDGIVVPCCFDKNASNPMGSFPGKDFEKTWKSDEYDAFRNKIFQERKTIEICKNCTS